MSDQLQLVATARDLRIAAEREFRRSLVIASDAGHSLREIAGHAGIHFTVVRHHLRKEREKT